MVVKDVMVEVRTSVFDFDLPPPFQKLLTEKWNISKLYPPQSEAIIPILDGKNTLVAIPTASGKSLIAYMGICLLYTSPSPRD